LDMSRLEMGKMEFKKDDLDMGLVVAETLKEYQVAGSRKKLSLEFVKPEGGTLWAVGDRDKVKQVLINLIGNGLKFTEEGGVTIGLSMKGKTVKAAVTDTGRGVPKKNQSLLFRKFQQAGSSIYTRDVVQGTGLGLYISKLLVEGMGGTIALEKSEVGKGSTFVFSLPVAEVKDES
ncbi:MAG: PAS/PAC sensor signal transduction histidine kinase, partial [Parcubacteria group bacterium GW2011_GWC1_43_11]